MMENLLILISVTQIYIIFIVGFPVYCKILMHLALKKNPEWVINHPEFNAPALLLKIAIWISYAIAAVSAIAIIQYAVVDPTPEYYFGMSYFPLVASSLEYGVILIAINHFVTKKIPAPERATASLTSRNLATYISPWIVYLGASVIVAGGLVYGWAYSFDVIDRQLAFDRLTGISLAMVIGTWAFIYILKRKHSDVEEILGKNGRKYETWMNVVGIYIGAFVVIWRVLEDFFGIYFVDFFTFMVITNVSIQIFVAYFSYHPKVWEILQINDRATQKRSSLIT